MTSYPGTTMRAAAFFEFHKDFTQTRLYRFSPVEYITNECCLAQ
jgi:hypothetical protein